MTTQLSAEPKSQWSDEQLVDRFLQAKGARSQHTRIAYGQDLRAFLEYMNREDDQGLHTLNYIDAGHVDAYYAHLCELVTLEQMAKSTANRRIAAVSSLYRWGMRPARRMLTGLTFNPVDVERFKVVSKFSDRVLSEAQVLQLIEMAANPPSNRYRNPGRNAALIRFLYVSGCRVSEACSMTWQQFRELEDGGAIATFHGKGDKTRYVRINVETWQQLRNISEDRKPSQRVFDLTRDGIAKVVSRTAHLIGIEHLTPHVMRHSHATHALRRGVNLKLIKDTLGHAQLNTTENYLQANPSDSSGLHLLTARE